MRSSASGHARLAFAGSMLVFGTIGLLRRFIDLPSAVIACFRGLLGCVLLLLLQRLRGRKPDLAALRRYLPAREDAEDAVQQVFLAVAERFDRLEHLPPPELEAYLVVTAERKAIDILRHQAKRGGVPFDENTPLVTPAPCGSPLADAMGRLPPRYREALLLRYGCGYDTRETAALLGLSVAAAQ